jgi:arsenate reductase
MPAPKPSASPAVVLAYSGCSTCKNAIAWLKEHDVAHVVRPIVEQPPTVDELGGWIPASGVGVKKWLNTSGQSYRALGKEKVDAANEATLVKWLAKDGKLVKRPVLVRGDKVVVGFRPDAYAALFAGVLAALLMLGCKDDKKDAPVTAPSVAVVPPASASVAPPVAFAPKPSPRFDVVDAALLFGEANKVASAATKTKIDDIQQVLRTDDAVPSSAVKDLNADVVAGMKAGKIDMAKLEPRFVALDNEREVRRGKEAEAVNALWAALDPAERRTVVAEARAAQAARERALQAPKDKENAEESAEQQAEWKRHRVERMAKDLGLDSEQQKKVEPIVTKPDDHAAAVAMYAEAKKKTDPLLAAFESDAFDAKKLDAFKAPGKKGRGAVESGIKLMSQIVPILKPDQREKLAATFDTRMMMVGMTHSAAAPGGRARHMRPFGAGGPHGGGGGGGHTGEVDDRP